MKKNIKIFLVLLIILLILTRTIKSYANAAEPPSILIISKVDDNIEIYLYNNKTNEKIKLKTIDRKYERYHVLYNNDYNREFYKENSLIVKSNINEEEYVIKDKVEYNRYNTVYRLNHENSKLEEGKGIKRSILLIASRVCITLILELIIFMLFGFKEKRSIIIFLIVNLFTQLFLNYNINNMLPTNSYIFFNIIFLEIVILITELITLNLLIKEHNKLRISLFVLTANILSFLLGGYLITILPI